MEITILGSGTGTPSLKRSACGLFVKIEQQNLLFDTGPGTIRKLLEIGVSYHDPDCIFYSHFHTDHTLDLATFLFAAKYALSLRSKELTIFGPRGLEKFYQAFLNLYGEVIRPEDYILKLKEIEEEELEFEAYKVKTLRMQHTPESLGYRIESDGKALAYSGDTDICNNLIKLGQNADILILDCSFPDEMKVKGHLTPQEAANIARVSNCKRLVLSHLYPVCQPDQILAQAKEVFDGEIAVAYDLMKLSL